MQKQNLDEYKILRAETESVKKCITDYMRFLFIGIGVLFSAWGKLSIGNDVENTIPMAFSALLVSVLAMCMLLLLIYKFVSHNRYAAYCLLLNQETWIPDSSNPDHMLIWELSLATFRQDTAGAVAKIHPSISSLKYLCGVVLSPSPSKSWAFPFTIVRIFVVMVLPCVTWGAYHTIPFALKVFHSADLDSVLTFIVLVSIFIFHIRIWTIVAQRLHSLMEGDYTITRFSERLRPTREKVLSKFGIKAQYIDIG